MSWSRSARLPGARRGSALRVAVLSLSAAAISLAAGEARASYVCQPLDVPGAEWTQVWQLNNAGEVAAGSSLGGHVFSGGAWLPLPAPPAGSGYAPADLNVLGINDAGIMAGAATSSIDPGSQQGFILSGGTYQFFSLPGYAYTEPRAISGSGMVTGLATDGTTPVGFVYNPGAAPGYAPGFTEFVPVLDGVRAWQIIPGAMNASGQFVGSANFAGRGRHAFLYDPAWQAHGYADLITFFQLGGGWTAARGINDKGYVVGFTRDTAGAVVSFLLTAQGHQLLGCPELPGAVEVYAESINDKDVVSGIWLDAAGVNHGFIAYPSAVLPVASVGGSFVFDVGVAPNTPVFLDPEPAVGYRYAIGAGDPSFASVVLPIGVGDGLYTVVAGGRAFELPAGQELDFTLNGFPGGVGAFEVFGIEPAANLDPASPTAFVTEVTFAGAGRFTGTMTPMTPADEVADLRAAVEGVGPGRSLAAKVAAAQAALAAGELADACASLGDLSAEVRAQSGKKLPAELANALLAQAKATRGALGCP